MKIKRLILTIAVIMMFILQPLIAVNAFFAGEKQIDDKILLTETEPLIENTPILGDGMEYAVIDQVGSDYYSIYQEISWTGTGTKNIQLIRVPYYETVAGGTLHLMVGTSKGTGDIYNGVISTDNRELNPIPVPADSWTPFIDTITNFNLTANTTYWLQVWLDGAGAGRIAYESTGDIYPNHTMFLKTSGYTEYPNADMYFQMWENPMPTEPEVTTGSYIDNGWLSGSGYNADLYAFVDNDFGESLGGYMYYRDYTDNGSWLLNGSLTIPATGENYTVRITNLTVGHLYQYKAMVNNASYTVNATNTANFTVSVATIAPTLRTMGNLLTTNTANLSATLYGKVDYDGGANVTAGFYWQEAGTANWTNTANTSDLITLDLYSKQISGLSVGTLYEYQTRGFNAYGSYNSSTAQFTLIDVTQPDVETLTAINITATSAILRGELIDMGNDPDVDVWFRIRETGVTGWTTLISQSLNQTGIFYYDTTELLGSSLTPDTSYDYQAIAEAHITLNDELLDYGDNRTFTTLPINTPPNIVTGGATYAGDDWNVFVTINGFVNYDGGSKVTGFFKYKRESDLEFLIWNVYRYDLYTGDNYSVNLFAYLNEWYTYQACGFNVSGEVCGSERQFRVTNDDTIETDTTTTTDDDVITTFEDMLDNLKESLHLTGAMGNWALMFLILLLLAIVFGSAMFSQKDNDTAKTVIGVVWGLMSIAVVGGFIFTKTLGIMPILILVGAFVIFVMIIITVMLGKGGQNNG